MLPMPVRVKFTKVGTLQFISHLDLQRTMQNIIIRAKLPIHYSEGFNPHPKMAFAVPLSIGAESVCELIDFKLDAEIPYDQIAERLNSAFPPEMKVIEAYEPKTKFTDIHFAEYLIETPESFSTEPLEQDVINVMKRTKSGTRETDIKGMIASWERTDKGILCLLAADSSQYLNPEYIALILGLGDYSIMRKRFMCTPKKEFR